MLKPNGINHLAIACADMKGQLEFFTDVLGMELVALYWMHGVEGAWHAFVKANDTCYIALMFTPEIAKLPIEIGKTHSGNAGSPCAPGTMQHLAFNVDSMEDMYGMRDRIRSRGINVFGPIDHGMCQSIYFAGPENLALEITTAPIPIPAKHWIDPEVVALAGISPEDLERFKKPADYKSEGGAVPQPKLDMSKPHLTYPPGVLERNIAMSDEDYWNQRSMTTPPVP